MVMYHIILSEFLDVYTWGHWILNIKCYSFRGSIYDGGMEML